MKKSLSLDQVVQALHSNPKRESIYLYLLLNLFVFVGECAITEKILIGKTSLAAASFQHTALLLLIIVILWILQWFSFDVRLVLALFVFTLFLGPLGAFAGLALGGFYLLYRKLASPFSALLEQLFPEEQLDHPVTKLALRIQRGLENVDVDTTAIPFMDIMTFGSLTQRLRAVGLTLRYFHPRLSPVLQTGLKDPNNSVRVLAATSLLALDKHYYNNYLELDEEVRANPRSRFHWLAFAKHAEDYANSRILSSERETKMLKVARQAYESYATLTTMQDEIVVALARIDLRLGDAMRARHSLEELVKRGVRDATVIELLQEAMFRLSDYPGLRALSTYVQQELTGNEMDKEVVSHLGRLWTTEAHAQT